MVQELTPKEIVDKDFSTGLRGYNQQEVDEFLDIIIRDYDAFAQEIADLKAENERLIERIDSLSAQQEAGPAEVTQVETAETIQATPNNSVTNFDILKRISNLERHVFGNKLSQEKNSPELPDRDGSN